MSTFASFFPLPLCTSGKIVCAFHSITQKHIQNSHSSFFFGLKAAGGVIQHRFKADKFTLRNPSLSAWEL